MPKISVIMPVYNGEKYLREAVDSILNQTFSDFEFIIINDASTDGTEEIIKSYKDDRIIYLKNEQNLGVAGTLNRGLDVAKGEYIARMDADDISLPERFEKQVKYMDKEKECVICGSNTILFGHWEGRTYVPCTDAEIRATLLFAPPFTHPTVMMRKTFLDENNLRYSAECEGFEDYNMWADFAFVKKGEFYNFSQPLLKYRIHSSQATQKRLLPKQKELEKNLRIRVIELLTGERDETIPEILAQRENLNYDIVLKLYDECREVLKKCDNKYHDTLMTAISTVGSEIYDTLTGKMLLKIFIQHGDICAPTVVRKFKMAVLILRKTFFGIKQRLCNKENQGKNRVKLKRKDFTIISNNCWGGLISQKYGLPYRSPTCGLLILGDDYIKFCVGLKHYLSQKLEFISLADSKYGEMFKDANFPVAKLDDIEVYFMHYTSNEEAEGKWYRRAGRVNWDFIVYKISERETFTPELMRKFAELPLENKLIFASRKYTEDTVVIDNIDSYIGDETPVIEKYFDEATYLNQINPKA